MFSQKLKLVGRLSAVLKKEDGSIEKYEQDNLIVAVGVDFVCDCLAKTSSRPAILGYIAVGTGITAVSGTDTTLTTELSRKAATYNHSSSTDIFTMASTFNPGEATGTITEAGVFNAVSSGIMFNHVVFTAIPKGAGDTLDVTFTITLTPT